MKLQFTGIGAAYYPVLGSNCAFFEHDDHLYLIDCGESTFKTMFSRDEIFRYEKITVLLTHLHADHIGSLGSFASYCKNVLNKKVLLVAEEDTVVDILQKSGVKPALYHFTKDFGECSTDTLTIKPQRVSHANDTHTIASGHAYNTIYEMARSASDKGLKLLGITDHGPAMLSAVPRNYFNNFKMLPRELYGVRVMFGCELNILDYDGNVDLELPMLKKQDYTVASIHKACFEVGTVEQNTNAYINAMKNPYVQIIGHPDDEGIPVDYDALVRAAKENHVLLEMNSESLHPRCARNGTRSNYLIMLDYCKKYQVPIILDSDAHCEIDVGNHDRSKTILEEIGFPEELVVNRSLEAAAEFIPFLRRMLDGKLNPSEAAI